MTNYPKILSSRFDKISPTSVAEYTANTGFVALKKAFTMQSLTLIEEIKTAKLFGRGGAAYPTGLKLEQAYAIKKTPKYVVCNADEGEPGTFKDRDLLAKDPLQLIEGMTIGAYILGANQGYIYIRGEYSGIAKIVVEAIVNARVAGYLGENICNSGFNFDIKVISGAGAYVCGENTALVESIEGKAGRPRKKPPYIKNAGLHLLPTLLNNVETFSTIPWIISEGGEKFLSIGTEFSGGTKLMSLSGNVTNPGNYEVPFGTTFRELLYDLGGGIPNGKKLKFIHVGGQSGPCFPESFLDTKLCYEDLKKNCLALGSGATVVVDDSNCPVDYLKVVMEFFSEESCGKCSPCRVGNHAILEILQKLSKGLATNTDLQNLHKYSKALKTTSFCGLGQSSCVALMALLKHFPEEIEQHVNGICPTGKCKIKKKVLK